MVEKKTLLVTAKYGSLEFAETAWPYNENVLDAQVDDCVESIKQQIVDAECAEMMDAFLLSEEIL